MVSLVVGANGQLGAECCAELRRRGGAVRGTVRRLERGRRLAESGVDIVEMDLTRPVGFAQVLDGVDTVLLTASPMVPRKGDDPPSVEAGMAGLVDAAVSAGVRRFVLVSLPETPRGEGIPAIRARRRLEERLRSSPLDDVVVRFPPFMETWLALVGSSIPLRAEPYATIGRPSPFLQMFRRATHALVEGRGLMLVPGPARMRNAVIAERDVAAACVEAVERRDAVGRVFEVGGPQVLTWRDVAAIYAELLGRKVRILSTPAGVYSAAARALAPVATVPSATMDLNLFVATTETAWSPGGGGLVDPAGMLTVRRFLERKASLPARLPVVA